MKALLLAAGIGSRLRPITNYVPKCLVPINGKPLLQYWLENLFNAGIQEFLINTNYLSEQVEDFVSKSPFKNFITLVYEEELLNTGGTLLKNRDFFKDESFMLVHADNLSFCDFSSFMNSHKDRNENAEITMMTFLTDDPKSCGIVEIDDRNLVRNFYEKIERPPSNLANAAVYICEKSIFDFLETFEKDNIDFSVEVIPNYIGKINTFLNDGYHRDIGTILSYALAQIEVKKFI